MRDPADNRTADLLEYISSGEMKSSPLLSFRWRHVAEKHARKMRQRNNAWVRKQAAKRN